MKYVITVDNREGFGFHNKRITKCDKIVKFTFFSPTTSGRAATWLSGTAQVILGFRLQPLYSPPSASSWVLATQAQMTPPRHTRPGDVLSVMFKPM